jgi:antimicrobial peptide system SdpA family protein
MKNNKLLLSGFTGLLICFWLFFVYQIAVASMPYNPLAKSRITMINLKTVIPEGWAFFTRSPREPQLYVYQKKGDNWEKVSFTNGSPKNLFGVSRVARASGLEIGSLLENARPSDWVSCDAHSRKCVDWDCLEAIPAVNAAYYPVYSGEIIVEERQILPWAWSRSCKPDLVPTRVVKLNALCLN